MREMVFFVGADWILRDRRLQIRLAVPQEEQKEFLTDPLRVDPNCGPFAMDQNG